MAKSSLLLRRLPWCSILLFLWTCCCSRRSSFYAYATTNVVSSSSSFTQRTINSSSSNKDHSIETFEINLDLPPQERWIEVVTVYKTEILDIVDWILDHVVHPYERRPLEVAFDEIEHYFPNNLQIREEMEGVATLLGVSPGIILFLNLFYEMTNSCTSVVANDGIGGIWHGRNLDYGIPNLQSIEVHLQFTKDGGKVVYEGTTFAMYIGIPTGMRPGGFSISQDQRYKGDPRWENIVEMLLKGGQGYSFMIRDILEHVPTYEEALERLQTTPLISPAYLIIAGTQTGEGAIISRERNGPADTWQLSEEDEHTWFLVQTNDDHWLPPDDGRRDATNEHLRMYSPETMNSETMLKVMNMHPTLNELTMYTSVISAKENYFYSIKQNVSAHGDDESKTMADLTVY